MYKHPVKRGLSLGLALMLVLSLLPVTALAAETDGLCQHHTAHDDDCGYVEAVEAQECTHVCEENSECFTIRCAHEHQITCYTTDGKLNCSHACTSEPACYTPVNECVHEHDANCGYAEAVEGKPCTYAVNGCEECEAEEDKPSFTLIELVATDITLDETVFEYTGKEIQPNVTVRAGGRLLTLGQDYTLEYADNIEPGTARVIVTGIATASETVGYTGTVEHPFYINPKTPEETEYPLVEIKGTDVTIEGTRFEYTGEAIEPAVTVTLEGKVLTAGKDYSLKYTDNVQPGTATAIVTGIATATETGGYTGEVRINFTIVEKEEVPPTETEPEETEPEETQPEETQPEETQPEETQPEETQPEETEPETVTYSITKGSGATWNRGSGKRLSFTADGEYQAFDGVSIDGKKLNPSYYTVKDGTVVSLKSLFLEKLGLGKHTVTIHFADGDAEGTFTVAKALSDSNPKTGDDSGIHLWVAVLFVSLVGLAGMVFIYRKKLFK